MTIATDNSRSYGPNQYPETELNEDLINDLIAVIWPLLDQGVSKGDIRDAFGNALDSWTPEPRDE